MKVRKKDNRSTLARRITDRHYRSIGSIPPLPLWQVVDEEMKGVFAALKATRRYFAAVTPIGTLAKRADMLTREALRNEVRK